MRPRLTWLALQTDNGPSVISVSVLMHSLSTDDEEILLRLGCCGKLRLGLGMVQLPVALGAALTHASVRYSPHSQALRIY